MAADIMAALMGGKPSSKSAAAAADPAGEMPESDQLTAASELLAAIEGGDAQGLADALNAFLDLR